MTYEMYNDPSSARSDDREIVAAAVALAGDPTCTAEQFYSLSRSVNCDVVAAGMRLFAAHLPAVDGEELADMICEWLR